MADTARIEVDTATVGCDGGGGASCPSMVYLKDGEDGRYVWP